MCSHPMRFPHPQENLVAYSMDGSEDKRDRVLKAAVEVRSELVGYARALLGSYAAADDVLQEAMIVVVKKFDDFQEGTSMLAWCRSIVRIEALRVKQRYRRERKLAERLLDDAIDMAFEEFQVVKRNDEAESSREALRACLEQVPDRGQNVLRARFAGELSYQQIGEQLGMTIEAVRKSLFRLKKQLRSCVENRLRVAQ